MTFLDAVVTGPRQRPRRRARTRGRGRARPSGPARRSASRCGPRRSACAAIDDGHAEPLRGARRATSPSSAPSAARSSQPTGSRRHAASRPISRPTPCATSASPTGQIASGRLPPEALRVFPATARHERGRGAAWPRPAAAARAGVRRLVRRRARRSRGPDRGALPRSSSSSSRCRSGRCCRRASRTPTGDFVGLANFVTYCHDADAGRTRCFNSVVGRGARDRDRGAARLRLRLCADAQPHAGQGPVLRGRAAADLRALAAVGARR